MVGWVLEEGAFHRRKKTSGYSFLPAQRTEKDGEVRQKCMCPMLPFKSL